MGDLGVRDPSLIRQHQCQAQYGSCSAWAGIVALFDSEAHIEIINITTSTAAPKGTVTGSVAYATRMVRVIVVAGRRWRRDNIFH